MQFGMDPWQWEATISLRQSGAPRLRVAIKSIKQFGTIQRTSTDSRISSILAPLLQRQEENHSWWKKVLLIIEDENWKIVSPVLLNAGKLQGDIADWKDRLYCIKHMTRTLLEIICHRRDDANKLITQAARASLPKYYRDQIYSILGVQTPLVSSKPLQQPIYTEEEDKASTTTSTVVALKKDDKKQFRDVFLCALEAEVPEGLEKFLQDTSNRDYRDFSYLGNDGNEKYIELSNYMIEKSSATDNRIGIAVIDSGCNPMLLNKRKIKHGSCFNYINTTANILEDREGHGTLVTEIIHRYAEFAHIRFYHYIVFGEDAVGHRCDIIHALRDILHNHKNDIQIVNMSLQMKNSTSDLKEVLDEIGREKIIISAAGNDMFGGMQFLYPAMNAMVIPVDGIHLDISAHATKPFVHITCPAHCCIDQAKRATSFAAPHASGCAAILLRIADIMDKEDEANLKERQALDDALLVRIAYGWPWGADVGHIQTQLSCCQTEEADQAIEGNLTRREMLFTKLQDYMQRLGLDFYTVCQVLINTFPNVQLDTLETLKSTTELYWYVADHVINASIAGFAKKITHELKQRCRRSDVDYTEDILDWEKYDEHVPNRCAHMRMLRLLMYYKQQDHELTPETLMQFLIGLKLSVNDDDYLEDIVKGPKKMKLMTCTEHMRTVLMKAGHNTNGLMLPMSEDTPEQAVQFALKEYRRQIENIARNQYYPKEISKFIPSFQSTFEANVSVSSALPIVNSRAGDGTSEKEKIAMSD